MGTLVPDTRIQLARPPLNHRDRGKIIQIDDDAPRYSCQSIDECDVPTFYFVAPRRLSGEPAPSGNSLESGRERRINEEPKGAG